MSAAKTATFMADHAPRSGRGKLCSRTAVLAAPSAWACARLRCLEAPGRARVGSVVTEAGREHLGWVLHESGRADAEHTVLLLPGALGSEKFYDDVLAEPSIRDAPIRFVATTLPGFCGTRAPADESVESYASAASRLASDLGCDTVVGHSLGANVAIKWQRAASSPGRWCSSRQASRARTNRSFPASSTESAPARPPALFADAEDHWAGNEEWPAACPPRRSDRRAEEQRPSLPPPTNPPVSVLSRPPPLTRPTIPATRTHEPGSCSANMTTSRSPQTSDNCSE